LIDILENNVQTCSQIGTSVCQNFCQVTSKTINVCNKYVETGKVGGIGTGFVGKNLLGTNLLGSSGSQSYSGTEEEEGYYPQTTTKGLFKGLGSKAKNILH